MIINSNPLTPTLSPLGRGEGEDSTRARMSACVTLVLIRLPILMLIGVAIVNANNSMSQTNSQPVRVRLITLDPGHFHASLVQKFMYARLQRRRLAGHLRDERRPAEPA